MTQQELNKACEWLIKNWVTYINSITNTVIPAYKFAQYFRDAMKGISGNKREIPPKYDADYLQTKIDAFTKAREKDGKTADEVLEECRGGALELTWQDVRKIVTIADEYIKYTEPTTTEEEYYEQVLKRFKEEQQ